jgi:hypothetical protein
MSARTSPTHQDRAHAQQRRRQVRGLLLIAAVVLVFAILRAGVGHVFTPGWWRLW